MRLKLLAKAATLLLGRYYRQQLQQAFAHPVANRRTGRRFIDDAIDLFAADEPTARAFSVRRSFKQAVRRLAWIDSSAPGPSLIMRSVWD